MGPCQSENSHSQMKTTNKRNNKKGNKTRIALEKECYARKDKLDKKSEEEATCEHYNIHDDSCHSCNSIPNSTISFTIEATLQPKDSLLFIKKGNPFSFCAIKGQWSFLPENGMTSYQGYSNVQSQGCNVGCLQFRILGGHTQIAELDKVYIADSTGMIQFFPNIDENDFNFYHPKGTLDLSMKGIQQMPQSTINSACGWANFKSSKSSLLSESENMVVDYINKIRVAPQLFASLYLNGNSTYCEIDRVLSEFTSIPHLEVNESLTQAAQSHAKDIGESGITGHIGTDNSTLKGRVSEHFKVHKLAYFGENCYYGSDNPLSIAIEMISDNKSIDKSNRMNILNPQYNSIGLSIYKHHSFKWCCVIVFGETSNDNRE